MWRPTPDGKGYGGEVDYEHTCRGDSTTTSSATKTKETRAQRPWACWGYPPLDGVFSPEVHPFILEQTRGHPFDILVAMAAAHLAYIQALRTGAVLEFGTAAQPFIVDGKKCHALFTVRRFFQSGTGTQLQKLTLHAKLHEDTSVRQLLILAFRGTKYFRDVMRDTMIGFDEGLFSNEGLDAHAGFAAAISNPNELSDMLRELKDNAESCDGLVITGHSLGGGVAQVASLRARQLYQDLSKGVLPAQDVLARVIADISEDEIRKQRVLALLKDTRCITFGAPMAFGKQREETEAQRAACEWLGAHAINYCCGTDLVPLLPCHARELRNFSKEVLQQLMDKRAVKFVLSLAKLVLKLSGSQETFDLLKQYVSAFTDKMCEQCEKYASLVPTVFVAYREPAHVATTEAEVANQLKARADIMCMPMSSQSCKQVEQALSCHQMKYAAPLVMASIFAVPTTAEETRAQHPWACWGDCGLNISPSITRKAISSPAGVQLGQFCPMVQPFILEQTRGHPFDILVAMAAAHLAYIQALRTGAVLEFGTAAQPFIVDGKKCHALFTVRRFFQSGTGTQLQKLTLHAKLHEDTSVRQLLILAFRGTKYFRDVMRDTMIGFDEGLFSNEGLDAHAGFAAAISNPNELSDMLRELKDNAESCDGLVITGHSLGGGVAQVASLRARQLYQDLSKGVLPAQDVLARVIADISEDEIRKQRVLALLKDTRCITFGAPMAFGKQREETEAQRAACEWLGAHAINYCCGTDLVPLLPCHARELRNFSKEVLQQLTDNMVKDCAPNLLKLLPDEVANDLRLKWGKLSGSQKAIDSLKQIVLTQIDMFTDNMYELSQEYTSLVPTVFVAYDEPTRVSTTEAEVADGLKERADSMCRSPSNQSHEQVEQAIRCHQMEMVAPFVMASIVAVPPDGLYVPPDVFKEGWLKKQGGHIKSWKDRWASLSHKKLSYFETNDPKAPEKGHFM